MTPALLIKTGSRHVFHTPNPPPDLTLTLSFSPIVDLVTLRDIRFVPLQPDEAEDPGLARPGQLCAADRFASRITQVENSVSLTDRTLQSRCEIDCQQLLEWHRFKLRARHDENSG